MVKNINYEITNKEDIVSHLMTLSDEKYRDFTSSLNPSVSKDSIIGVRVPLVRQIAKSLKDSEVSKQFMQSLPHTYLEENHLHGFLIEHERDFSECIKLLEKFLPYIDNWATCDSIRPKVFKKHSNELFPYIEKWLTSSHTYIVRYAIGILLSFYLDDNFDAKHLDMVARIRSDEYYINMMIAWYFATALAKQYDSAVVYIENNVLSQWTHNKTIQKACESFRVIDEHKVYLKTLKIK